ncbi:hypothetical protein AAG570_010141 [Ranatra chinensis]|uniref:Uncharacterized protein n=1 Tax=Ranatra chinensis TaxID=642074 RepID=A0ABD0YNU8_9HEMI
MGSAWRPPTSPKSRNRRGRPPLAPPRSQSVEALLDSAPSSNNNSNNQQSTTTINSCAGVPQIEDRSKRAHSVGHEIQQHQLPEETPLQQTEVCTLELTSAESPPSPSFRLSRSTDSLALASDADTLKRKRNFMDRCVNKMRSLIKK